MNFYFKWSGEAKDHRRPADETAPTGAEGDWQVTGQHPDPDPQRQPPREGDGLCPGGSGLHAERVTEMEAGKQGTCPRAEARTRVRPLFYLLGKDIKRLMI